MSERQLTILERWALAIGAPVIAAGVLAVWGVLWQMYNTQVELGHQLSQMNLMLEGAYTEHDAEREFSQVDHRLDGLTGVLDYHAERLDEHGRRLEAQDERLRRIESRQAFPPPNGGEE